MSDSFSINIQPGNFSITRLVDNTVLLSSNYNYLIYDPSGTNVWPVSPTISSAGGNLTWQLNGQQIALHNNYYAAGAKVFDTYIMPMTSLNPSVASSNYTTTLASNQQLVARSV